MAVIPRSKCGSSLAGLGYYSADIRTQATLRKDVYNIDCVQKAGVYTDNRFG